MDAKSSSGLIDTNPDVDDPNEKAKLLDRKNDLLQRIEQVRIDRLSAQSHIGRVRGLIEEWNHCYNAADYEKSRRLSEYGDILQQMNLLDQRIELCTQCNVTNDCFYIWYKGNYGTINGLRLGYVDHPTHGHSSNEGDTSASSTNGSLKTGASSTSGDTKVTPSTVRRSSHNNQTSSSLSKITWLEVNTALGLAAQLLSILQKKQDSCIRFSSYEILCMGCYTKIGEKQKDQKLPIWYNLYYNDEHSLSFLFSQRRIFNKALNGLGHCLADAIECARKRDRTFVVPYSVVLHSQGNVSIDNIPISLGNNGEEWTRVMKYFLTDLKWLVVYTTRHVDR